MLYLIGFDWKLLFELVSTSVAVAVNTTPVAFSLNEWLLADVITGALSFRSLTVTVISCESLNSPSEAMTVAWYVDVDS